MAENPWRWSGGRSPYRRTPFQVLDLGMEVRGRGAIRQRVERRRRRIRNAPGRYRLFDEPLTEAHINEAEQLLRDPAARLYAELCTHQEHDLELDRAELDELRALLEGLATPTVEVRAGLEPARLLGVLPPLPRPEFPPVAPWLDNHEDEEERDDPGRRD
jgi:hypothetical protein